MSGKNKEVRRIFNVHREAIGSWIKMKEEKGYCKSKKGYQKVHSYINEE